MIYDQEKVFELIRYFERCLEEHGTGAAAVDWNSSESAALRYGVMCGLFSHEREKTTVLDFGCGRADFKEFLDQNGWSNIVYEGLDISSAFVASAQDRYPETAIYCLDVQKEDVAIPMYDYIVMNGVFNRRSPLTYDEMLAYMEHVTSKVFRHCRKGLAFNVMSHCSDWKTEELFHPSPNDLVDLIGQSLSPHFQLRNDYGAFESTCYVYTTPRTEHSRGNDAQCG